MEQITIDLQERSYPVYVGNNLLSVFPEVYAKHRLPRTLAIVTDRNVARLYLPQLINSLHHQGYKTTEIIIGVGERQKSLARVNTIFNEMLKARIPKNSAILALGGGVTGDVAGFVAATYRRGIPLVHIPTTLLAQVESALGGKVAVNHPLSKNAIGTYYQPVFVFSDIRALSTLPAREIVCGLGEVLKYALLSETMFSYLDQHLEKILQADSDIIQELVLNCNRMKAKMIADDERETDPVGGRAVLNLGHTIGHALEHLSHYKLHHGEAVLIGLRWELKIARKTGLVNREEYERIDALLHRVNFNPHLRFLKRSVLLRTLFGTNRTAKFVLPKKVGEVVITNDVDVSIVRDVLNEKKKFNSST